MISYTRPRVLLGAAIIAGMISAAHGVKAQTIEEIGALPTTILWWDFETPGHGAETDLYYGRAGSHNPQPDSFLTNHPNGYPNNFGLDLQTIGNVTVTASSPDGPTYPVRENVFSEFGNGTSMKFTLKGNATEKASGDLILPFKRFGSQANNYTFAQFGPGGEFWVRFALRQDQQLISPTTFFSRLSDGGHQSGIKRILVHGSASSGSLEEAIQDTSQRRIPQMYSDSGYEHYGAQDFIGCSENDSATPDNFNDPANYPEPPCRRFKADMWTSYQIHVVVADNAQKNNGLVELYLDDEPSPIIRVTNADHSGLSITQPYIENGTWDSSGNDEKGYGKLTFTLFSTDKAPKAGIPDGHMWIDNIVVSRTRVPKITVSGTSPNDTLSPSAPSNVSAQ